ncbi:MAG: ABC transporter permease [Roseburia sp.]|nr:ABC transporter permease [Roseburia sp.]
MIWRKVFDYEKSRIKNSKSVFIAVAAVFLLTVSAFFLFCALSPAESQYIVSDRNEAKNTYYKYIADGEAQLASPYLTDSERTEIKLGIERYKFYLETDTVESDYLPIDNFTSKFKGYGGSSILLRFAHFSFYPFCILAIAGGVYLIGQEKDKNILKNILAPDIPRGKLYATKLAINFLMTFAPVIISAAVLGIAGAFVPHGNFLVYSGGYKPLNAYALYWQIILGNFSAQLLLYSVSVLLCLFFKRIFSVGFTVVGYLFFAVLVMIVYNSDRFVELNVQTFESVVCIPLAGIQNYTAGLDVVFWAVFIAHLALSAAVIAVSYSVFGRRDLV